MSTNSSICIFKAHGRCTFNAVNYAITELGLPIPREFMVFPWPTRTHLAIALKFHNPEDATLFKLLAPDDLFRFNYDNDAFNPDTPVWENLPLALTSKTMLSWRLAQVSDKPVGWFK